MRNLGWLSGEGPRSQIILSTRVRLARNLEGYAFPWRSHRGGLEEIVELLRRRFSGDPTMTFTDIRQVHPLEMGVLVEQHLASPAFAASPHPRALAISEDGSLSLMVNEEDHLRLQCLLSGLQLDAAWKKAVKLETFLASELVFAYDSQFGFLTACPSNAGTGLRASAMVHLPALAWVQALDTIVAQISQLGLAVRGVYGEGSQCTGHLLQISNQVTLGPDEDDILTKIFAVCEQLVHYELSAREQLMSSQKTALEDRVWRAYGLLRHARLLGSSEAIEHLSWLRLGIQLGFLPSVRLAELNQLMIRTRSANLQVRAGRELTIPERDFLRAELIREALQ